MIAQSGTYFGKPIILVCDAKCNKAWGINNRPRVQLSDEDDDYEYLSDAELGTGPVDPGTYEGGHAKPTDPSERLNKWCARECERCEMVSPNEDFELTDFSRRVRNIKIVDNSPMLGSKTPSTQD